jgi:hypothetical protein
LKKHLPAKKSHSSAEGKAPSRVGDAAAISTQRTGGKALLQNLFGVDPRSLAVFRIFIGTLLLADLGIRAGDLGAMYTDGGMFPRTLICYHYTTVWHWSFHFASGALAYQTMLFGLAAGLAVALLVGFGTRFVVIGSWLMLVSLQHRVPPILSGADILFRMLLFWGMFLPLGRVWSIDGWLQDRRESRVNPPNEPKVLSVASAAILFQMALMYLFSAIYKSNVQWLHGSVVAGALAHDFYASPLGPRLLGYPALMALLTWGTFILEWTGPFLLFCPKWTARIRLWVVGCLAAMHIGIAVCLEVDFFSPVSLAGLTLFLPAEFWNSALLARFSGPSTSKRLTGGTDAGKNKHTALFYVTQGTCALLFMYVLLVNINTLPGHPLSSQPPAKKGFLWTAFGLGQKWNMFDEIPSRNGWYVARARLKDGSEVDLLRGGAAVDWNKPASPAGLYPNHRWRKCFREMAYNDELGYQMFRNPVAQYLCREWDLRNRPQRQIADFDLVYCNDLGKKELAQVTIREKFVHLDFTDSDEEMTASGGL